MKVTEMVARTTDPHALHRPGVILNMVTTRAPERTPDQPCVDCLDHSLAAEQTRPAVRGRVAFWLAALILSITMLGTTLPTPLYVIYQAQWHFSAAIVTVTFAVYAVAVLATLLLAGRSSDQAGRKSVLAAALASSALSTVVFILAPNVGVLFVGRILSGLSAGLMTGTATAALTELVPASASRRASLVATAANMGGLGLGPLIAGLFAQYAPEPTVLVFEVYLAVLAVAGLCLFLVPETVSPRRRPALRFAGLGIPERGRSEFIAAGTAGFAAFSLLGLFAVRLDTLRRDEPWNHPLPAPKASVMTTCSCMTGACHSSRGSASPGRWPRSTPTTSTGIRSRTWSSAAAPCGSPSASPADAGAGQRWRPTTSARRRSQRQPGTRKRVRWCRVAVEERVDALRRPRRSAVLPGITASGRHLLLLAGPLIPAGR